MKINQELLELAIKVFGSREMAEEWFSKPAYGLGGAIPEQYAQAENGEEEVKKLLGRIEHGIFS